MKSTKEMIEVMQAYEDGKKIEYYSRISNRWETAISPIWSWEYLDYRIKPEPKRKESKVIWVNEYEDGYHVPFETEEIAKKEARNERNITSIAVRYVREDQ